MTSRRLRGIPLLTLILLLCSACPAMVNSPVGAVGGKTVSDKTSDSSDSYGDPFGETTAPPPSAGPSAAAPLPGPGAVPAGGDQGIPPPPDMALRRIEGGDAGVAGGDTATPMSRTVPGPVADSRDSGILSAPLAPEPLEKPDVPISCNVHILHLPVAAPWRNAWEFLMQLFMTRTASVDDLDLMQHGCDIQNIVDEGTARAHEVTDTTLKNWYVADFSTNLERASMYMGPGRYLFFRSVADRYPPPEEMGVGRTFANLEELKAFALEDPAKSKYLGEIFVAPVLLMPRGSLDPDMLPPSPVPGLRPGLRPIPLDPVAP